MTTEERKAKARELHAKSRGMARNAYTAGKGSQEWEQYCASLWQSLEHDFETIFPSSQEDKP